MNPRAPRALLVCILAGLVGGCGGFSSGGSPALEPPKPPEFANPENQGKVTGRVVVEDGFMRELADELPPAEASEEEGVASGSDVLTSMKVRVVGSRRARQAEVKGDGTFEIEMLPEGDYRAELWFGSRQIARFGMPVMVRQTTEATVKVLGFDLADLDEDGARDDLAIELEVRAGVGKTKVARTVMPDGSVRARLPDGGREYLLPGGVVRRESPGRGATFRRDHDLDGVADEDDEDYRRLRQKPPPVSDDALLLGRAFPPLIETAGVRAPHSEHPPADLALFTAELAEDFGRQALKVVATLHAKDAAYSFELRDDGGRRDLLPTWPGHQPSGDEVAGDGIYSYLLPVDATTRPLIYNRQVVVEAVDAKGRRSNRFTFFQYRPAPVPEQGAEAPARTPPPWESVDQVEFRGRQGSGGPEVQARFRAAPSLAGLVATLLGPGGFKRVFAPAGGGSEDGWVPFETRPAPLAGAGTYYIVLGVPEGQIFFAGRVLDQETSFLPRTGG